MKVSVRPVRRNAKKVGVTLRRSGDVKAAPEVYVREIPEPVREQVAPPVHEPVSLPDIFVAPELHDEPVLTPDESRGEQEVFPLTAPEAEIEAESEDDSELSELIEEVGNAIDIADEQFAEMEALVDAQEEEAPCAEEIAMPELEFEQTSPENIEAAVPDELAETAEPEIEPEPVIEPVAGPEPEIASVIDDMQPTFSEPVPEIPEEQPLPFADNSMTGYENVDVDGDGVPENNVFRRFFDRGLVKSEEKDADGVEYVCVDQKSGMIRKLFGMIKKHSPEDEE